MQRPLLHSEALRRARWAAFASLASVAALSVALASPGCATRTSSPESAQTTAIACENAFDCPRAPNTCMISTCVERYCAMVAAAEKTVMNEQKPGDCALLVCDGRGGTMPIEDPQDWPADDGNECTDEVCDEGKAGHPPVDLGAKCGSNGVCNGKGVCGVCLPGKRRCQGNSPEECSEEGQWAGGEACPEESPICYGDASCLRITGVTVGFLASCARFVDGSLRCWGDRDSGAVGGGSGAAPVVGLSGAFEIVAGRDHTCALLRDGTASCWGRNEDGELGDKTTTNRGSPAPVVGVADVAQVAVGLGFSCARLADGQVKCWGRNDKGQLGLGSAAKSAAPLSDSQSGGSPSGPPSFFREAPRATMISLAETHGCAVVPGGSAVCWGNDAFGQLGRGEGPPAPAAKGKPAPAIKPPAPVKGLKGASVIALGDAHACARLSDGSVQCWGDNASGQLGDGTTAVKTSPTTVNGLSSVVALALGHKHSCALLSSGGVRCWGDNASGQLGDDTTEGRPAPVDVVGLGAVRSIIARGDHTCAIIASGAIRCWGANSAGQLGDRSTENRPKPVPVAW